jgi:hypothetical protein
LDAFVGTNTPPASAISINEQTAQVLFSNVEDGDQLFVLLRNNSGYNTSTAEITGVSGGGANEFEVNTIQCTPTPTPTFTPSPTPTNTPTPTPTDTPTPTATPTEGGPGPEPAVCPPGGLVKSITGIDTGTGTFVDPALIPGPASIGGTRMWVQQPGGNIQVLVRPGERVQYLLDLSILVPGDTDGNLVLTDRYQDTYMDLIGVQTVDGTVATDLGSGGSLPSPLPAGFSFFDLNGELYIFNVPDDGTGAYADVQIITQVRTDFPVFTEFGPTVTNIAKVRGQIDEETGTITPVTDQDLCIDHFEVRVFGPFQPSDD